MGERYVRPPLVPREATSSWLVLWRFRLVAALILAVIVLVGFQLFQRLSGASDQNPGIGASPPVISRLR